MENLLNNVILISVYIVQFIMVTLLIGVGLFIILNTFNIIIGIHYFIIITMFFGLMYSFYIMLKIK